MIVTAWNNGQHHATGAGYGLKIKAADRDRYFRREWGSVILELGNENEATEINIDKPSFWNETCRELISADVGRWLLRRGLAPWSKGNPPKLQMLRLSERRFALMSPP